MNTTQLVMNLTSVLQMVSTVMFYKKCKGLFHTENVYVVAID